MPALFLRLALIVALFGATRASAAVFTDSVMASVLVASPGEAIYQAGGHAALRMQCPALGLDNVFSFENNNAGGLAGHLLGKTKGRLAAITFEEYCGQFVDEGREIKEYPVNLTDAQIRTLWRLLDQTVEMKVETDFNLRHKNCNSAVMDKLSAALGSEKIVMNEMRYSQLDNGELMNAMFLDGRPWTALVFCVALGADTGENDSWQTRTFPLIMDSFLSTAEIVSPSGARRPFLAAEPSVALAATKEIGKPLITPVGLAIIILGIAIVVSLADRSRRLKRPVRVADILLLASQTAAAIAVLVLVATPASIGPAWNWMLIPLNPLPVFAALFLRNPALRRRFFIIYGIACALFIFAPFITSEAGLWSSLLSAAIAIRVLSHYL